MVRPTGLKENVQTSQSKGHYAIKPIFFDQQTNFFQINFSNYSEAFGRFQLRKGAFAAKRYFKLSQWLVQKVSYNLSSEIDFQKAIGFGAPFGRPFHTSPPSDFAQVQDNLRS
jgi:hypothetical protein